MDYPKPIQLEPKRGFLSPFFVREFKPTIITVTDADFVDIASGFIPKTPLTVGEEIIVEIGIFSVLCYYKKELDIYNAWKTEQKAIEAAKKQEYEKQEAERRKLKSETFWATHEIPFDFSLEIKEVLSGLKEGTMLHAQKRSTVLHIYLQEDYTNGRFSRNKGDYLCANEKAKYGGNWTGNVGMRLYEFQDHREKTIRNIPTCKACLKILERFKKQTNNEQ